MKITITILDTVDKQLRKCAAEQSISISDLIVRAIEQYLAERTQTLRRRVKLPIVRSKRPGKLRISNTKIYKFIQFP